MAEVDGRKYDWYGFIVHRYCIRLSLPAPADSIKFQTTCILHLHLPNTIGDNARLTEFSHTPPAMAFRRFITGERQREPQTTERNLGKSDIICDFTKYMKDMQNLEKETLLG